MKRLTLLFTVLVLAHAAAAWSAEPSRPGWKVEFDGSGSAPVLSGGVIYVGSKSGAVCAFDPATGKETWRHGTPKGAARESKVVAAGGNDFSSLLEAAAEALKKRELAGTSEIEATPVVANGTVFVGSLDHHFYALDAATGEEKWSFDAGPQAGIRHTALLHGGRVLFAAGSYIHTLDMTTGERAWSFETLPGLHPAAKRPPEAPVLEDGVIYATAWPFAQMDAPEASFLYAVDAATGEKKWEVVAEGAGFVSAPVASDGAVFFASRGTSESNDESGWVHAVEAASGSLRWVFETKTELGGLDAVLAGGGLVYAASTSGLHAIDAASGKARWTLEGEFAGSADMRLDRHLYLRAGPMFGRNKVLAVDPSTGEEIWAAKLGSNVWIRSLDAKALYVSAGPRLVALDRETGKVVWKFKASGRQGGGVAAEPLRLGDRLIFATERREIWGEGATPGHLYSIDAATGKL